MTMFFVLALLPVIVYFIPIKIKNTNHDKYPLFIFFTTFFLMLALRHRLIGNDTSGYLAFFDAIHHYSWSVAIKSGWEYGFIVLTKLIAFITDNGQVYLAIISAIICIPFIYSYTRCDKMSLVKISLFLIMPTFTMAFSGLRQAIAISIGLLVFEATKRKKLIIALLFSVLSITFHISALLLLVIYPIYRMKLKKKYVTFFIAVFLTIFIFRDVIFRSLGFIVGDYYNITVQDTGAYTMLILFLIFAVFSFLVPNDDKLGDDGIGLRNLLLTACILQCFVPINNLAMRANYYFIVFIPLLIPKVISASSDRWLQVAKISSIVFPVFFFGYFLVRILTGGFTLTVVPYHFFWEIV